MMSEHPTDPNPLGEDDIVAQLMRGAGPRPSMPDAVGEDLRQQTRGHWRAMVARRRTRRRRMQWLAAAAGLALAVVGWTSWRQMMLSPALAPVPVARVESIVGSVHRLLKSPEPLGVGQELMAGAVVVSGDGGRGAMVLPNGVSVRLDVAGRLQFLPDGRLLLERGAVYIDAGSGDASVVVQTPFGLARDIGTQFEVRLDEVAWQVAVREGEVRIELPSGHHTAMAGERLHLAPDGAVTRRSEAPDDPRWSWARDVAPTMDLEGKSLAEALHWMARETGWQLAFEDPELQTEVQQILVYGSVGDLRPEEVPEIVLPSSGLSGTLIDGRLTIHREQTP